MSSSDPRAGPPTLHPDEPHSEALAALCAHLGRYRARGFVELLWLDEQKWWQEHEWNRLRAVAPELPVYELGALRALFPRSLVPPATTMRDAAGTNAALLAALFALMDGEDEAALETATREWLSVQRAHGVAVVRAHDADHEPTAYGRACFVAALDAIAPPAPRLEVARDESALVQSMLDAAPLLVAASVLCNQYDWHAADVYFSLTWHAWSDELATWERRHARFGRPQLGAWWYAGGPAVPDYERWRDAWLRVLDASSRRLTG